MIIYQKGLNFWQHFFLWCKDLTCSSFTLKLQFALILYMIQPKDFQVEFKGKKHQKLKITISIAKGMNHINQQSVNVVEISFYYIKVSGISCGNKFIKTIRYPHMWRYRWFHWYQVCLFYSTLNKITQFWFVESSTINPKLYSVGVPITLPWKRRNFVECTINKKSHDLLVQFVNNRYSWFWKFSNWTRLIKGSCNFENFQNHSYY